jgi:demethylmenaquinone methyltransferase/2-methoxy-6-polyprenyl-1,4-benzoquinol methylase
MTSYNKNDPETIKKMFNSIARQYDKTNAILSFRMHHHWNRTLIKKAIVPAKPEILLDLCCGTGAIAFSYLKKTQDYTKAYMLDFSEGMLECAQMQAKTLDIDHHDIHYLQADAQVIPLLGNSVHCATMAYGIRNVKDPGLCMKDVYRVLKPGGTFGILELTKPKHPFLNFTHSFYLKNILPLLGKLATSNKEAYDYLCNSIHTFIPPENLKYLMETVGFQDIQQHSLLGGVATVLVAKKPK